MKELQIETKAIKMKSPNQCKKGPQVRKKRKVKVIKMMVKKVDQEEEVLEVVVMFNKLHQEDREADHQRTKHQILTWIQIKEPYHLEIREEEEEDQVVELLKLKLNNK